MTKEDIINRIKHSLKIKEIMVKAADERLKQWEEELKTTVSLALDFPNEPKNN